MSDKRVVDYRTPQKGKPRTLLMRCLDIVQWGIAIGVLIYVVTWIANSHG